VADISTHRFKKSFPAFKNTDDELVEQKLNEAIGRVNDDSFATAEVARSATMYLAAHLLSISSDGEAARLALTGADTIYGAEWKRLCRAYTMGRGRVA